MHSQTAASYKLIGTKLRIYGYRFSKSPFLQNFEAVICCSRQGKSTSLGSVSGCVSISNVSLFEENRKIFFSILMNDFKSSSVYLLIFCLASGLLFWIGWFGTFLLPLQHCTLETLGQNSTLRGYKEFSSPAGSSALKLSHRSNDITILSRIKCSEIYRYKFTYIGIVNYKYNAIKFGCLNQYYLKTGKKIQNL